MGFALKAILRVNFVVRELGFENDGLVKFKFISHHLVISIGKACALWVKKCLQLHASVYQMFSVINVRE